ncbi:tol-pal system-associated acyl-CoA thioesterase [Roseobacter sp. HKCCA0434]|uniref:tol-pal system-associated acyl-CoA thioesterase n=1 Tax=Roseobacter sp. HKCCA0434 TaxID=3079297 RepID=UPI002905AA78|nr:tol-pal system-associated acyl-CoA thioesterase [Roseobacter sp. HKCCA0434]
MIRNTTIRVYYEDTDMAGVVYYANYLKYLERGRSDAVRDAGIDQLALRDAGLVFVVRRVEADYIRPARFDDVLTVETGLEDMRGARFTMPQRVLRGDEEILRARIDCAVMDLTGRPARLPAEIRHKLAEYLS